MLARRTAALPHVKGTALFWTDIVDRRIASGDHPCSSLSPTSAARPPVTPRSRDRYSLEQMLDRRSSTAAIIGSVVCLQPASHDERRWVVGGVAHSRVASFERHGLRD